MLTQNLIHYNFSTQKVSDAILFTILGVWNLVILFINSFAFILEWLFVGIPTILLFLYVFLTMPGHIPLYFSLLQTFLDIFLGPYRDQINGTKELSLAFLSLIVCLQVN